MSLRFQPANFLLLEPTRGYFYFRLKLSIKTMATGRSGSYSVDAAAGFVFTPSAGDARGYASMESYHVDQRLCCAGGTAARQPRDKTSGDLWHSKSESADLKIARHPNGDAQHGNQRPKPLANQPDRQRHAEQIKNGKGNFMAGLIIHQPNGRNE
jgi:hypothetical protein